MNHTHTLLSLSTLALAITASTGALAQDKTDGQWRGTGGAALSATSGNSSTSALQLNVDASRATTANKTSLGAMVNYGRSKSGGVSTTTSNKWGVFGQYDHNLSPRTFAFGRLALDGDKVIDLSLRSQLAAGLGYKLITTPAMTLDLFGGLGYTTEKYSVVKTIGGERDDNFARASVYLGEASSHQLTPTVSFKQRLDVYPGISGNKAVLAKFSAGLSVVMSSTLNLNVGLTNTYNSKPPAGTKFNDTALFTGINVKFGAN